MRIGESNRISRTLDAGSNGRRIAVVSIRRSLQLSGNIAGGLPAAALDVASLHARRVG